MQSLRDDWVRLDEATDLLENGPIDYLTDDEMDTLYHILDIIKLGIRDILSIQELGNSQKRRRYNWNFTVKQLRNYFKEAIMYYLEDIQHYPTPHKLSHIKICQKKKKRL